MLHLVLGRAGYGKSTYVKQKISEMIDQSKKSAVLLVPEQFSFATGNTYLELLGESRYAYLEITDFTRLCHEIKRIYGGESIPTVDNGGRALIMSTAINGVRDLLKLYNKNLTSYAFVNSILELHKETKYCDVGYETLLESSESTNNVILGEKLHDVSLIMGAYESIIENTYADSADDLTRLYSRLEKSDYFDNKTVFIDGFNGFTAQEIKILSHIFRRAADVYITLCADSISTFEDDCSLFSNVKQTAASLIRTAKDSGIAVASPVLLENSHSQKSDDLQKAEKYFLSGFTSGETSSGDIEIYSAVDYYDECTYAARTIKSLLRQKKYRCRDIAVVARDINSYKAPLENAFDNYDIPYFHDARQPVDCQPLINLIDYAVKSVITSFKTENVLSYAKTGLAGVSDEEISVLENYVLMWKISGKKWCVDFTQHPKGFNNEFKSRDEQLLVAINNTRKKLIVPLVRLKKACDDTTAGEIAKAIYALLTDIKADKNLLAVAKKLKEQNMITLAQEQNRIWDLTMGMLEQTVLTIGERHVDLKEFSELYRLMVSSQDLGSIPQGMDNVFISSADRAATGAPKVVFIMGANQDVFPALPEKNVLFSDKDKRALHAMGIEIFTPNERTAVFEKFVAYSAVTLGQDKLFVSYANSDMKSTALAPSLIVDEIKRIFPSVKEKGPSDFSEIELIESEKSAFEIAASRWLENTAFSNTLKKYFLQNERFNSRSKAVKRQTDSSKTHFENPEIAKKLFKTDMNVSASRTETYYKCPFMYFCKFGLNAAPRKKAELDPMQAGIAMHEVFEKLLSKHSSKELCKLDKEVLHSEVNEILKTYLEKNIGENSGERFNYLFLRLEKVINFVVAKMIDEFTQSDFETKAFELSIDKDSPVKPLKLDLPGGGSLSVIGKIDRVDIMEKNGEKYIRIIDYKSGSKEFALSDVLFGLNMQMLIYLMCVEENGTGEFANTIPAGVLYMPAKRPRKTMSRYEKHDDIKKKISREIRMGGMVLDDETVLIGMEKSLEGNFIPYSNSLRGIKSTISLDELHRVSEHIKSLLEQMGSELQKGCIPMDAVYSPKRYEKTCDYCDYSPVCVSKINKEKRNILELKHSEALAALKEGECRRE